ncbi:hypothetical protein PRIPAC_70185 [Pristionchus pacificus]|uniref:Uncharacterized protein n=1 Tax=Pristionchus pacificus TaxID=54126 RepID=A0A2A6C1I2_PRIPA|nr:hypothetical protein PRIPAC_70185 [Pristionchus pacificus]|eukprot:PDM71883.1 hypothetical protein PRIPAC_38290 [Pristionchus pacificus]
MYSAYPIAFLLLASAFQVMGDTPAGGAAVADPNAAGGAGGAAGAADGGAAAGGASNDDETGRGFIVFAQKFATGLPVAGPIMAPMFDAALKIFETFFGKAPPAAAQPQ